MAIRFGQTQTHFIAQDERFDLGRIASFAIDSHAKIPSLEAKRRIAQYLSVRDHRLKLKRYLGGGTDGEVWESNQRTAIKLLARERGYYNERDTYLRFKEFDIMDKLGTFFVPQLVDYCDELRIVEMEMMQEAPYIIEFAKVRLDRPPDFSDDILRQLDLDSQDQFEHHWSEVQTLLRDLESYQIYYLDPRPGNIMFPDMIS